MEGLSNALCDITLLHAVNLVLLGIQLGVLGYWLVIKRWRS